MARIPKIDRFNERVLSKFQIYNNLFLTLPFESIKKTGLYLPLFANICKDSYAENKSPEDIVGYFFDKYLPELPPKEQNDLLFQFIQYIERQVVLFDAIEDAGYAYVNNMHGRGTIRNIKEEATSKQKQEALIDYLNRFRVRIVLTAHPTQFYPGSVLGIINELSEAIQVDDLSRIKTLLSQLGKTRFYNKQKPTPLDEAISLIWYLENVFYQSASTIYNYLDQNIFEGRSIDNSIFDFGFWPGGDRDGNPFVTPDITRKTADSLRFSILRNYYRDIRKLKRKITFDQVDETISKLANLLLEELFYPKKEPVISTAFLLTELHAVKATLESEHNGIYSHEVGDMINKIKLFGFHFASLDIRQDSRVHNGVFETLLSQPEAAKHISHYPEGYSQMDPTARHGALLQVQGNYPTEILEKDSIAYNTLESIHAMKAIQAKNGEKGCNRYIISNCQSVENVLQLFAFFRLCDWENPSVDIIPLFETIPDLEAAEAVMRTLYSNPEYRAHLKRRGDKQTIMLGFSDGTKDGGYFMANWSIYKAKEVLSQLSKSFDLNVAFFDGRGGPPARGGGNTHKFYASMGDLIQSDDIQLTIQGQTISSNFGTLDSCQFNLEQLLSSGIENQVFASENSTLSDDDRATLEQLAQSGYAAYQAFKSHPQFVPYLEKMTTLPYYAKTNIGSRPAKRGKSDALVFEDLRAIPFVGGWSQSKQNVPGFYGVGTALQELKSANEFERAVQLYQNSRFFRTLIANSMMSMTKSFFQLTAYMAEDSQFGAFWTQIHEEFQLTKKLVLELTGMETLMEDEKAGKASIKVREEIVQPLLTIQQYALQQIQTAKAQGKTSKDLALFEKMVTRSLFGNINASRNSA